MVHGHVFKLGFVSNLFVMNTLLHFYVTCGGDLRVVRKLFEEMPERDVVSWNTTIKAHMSCGEVDCAIKLLDSMPERNLAAWNCVVWGLVNSGNIELANKVFQRMPMRNVVSWNAMIVGFVNNLMFSKALSVFDDMLAQGKCKPDETTLISVLSACAHMNLSEQGKWLESYIKENKFMLSLPLGNALIQMFATTGDLHNAKIIFRKMSKRCLITWRTMISGLANNGFSGEALKLFDIMCSEGQKPDNAIFNAVLAAFMDDGRLVEDGERLFRLFHQMVHDFGIEPRIEHYHSMMHILSRAGRIEEAIVLIESMHLEPNPFIWATVLSACKIHGKENLVESLVRKISDQKPNDPKYLYLITSLVQDTLKFDEVQDALKSHDSGLVQAQETLPHEEVYRALESLDRQLDLPENSDLCQVDSFDYAILMQL